MAGSGSGSSDDSVRVAKVLGGRDIGGGIFEEVWPRWRDETKSDTGGEKSDDGTDREEE